MGFNMRVGKIESNNYSNSKPSFQAKIFVWDHWYKFHDIIQQYGGKFANDYQALQEMDFAKLDLTCSGYKKAIPAYFRFAEGFTEKIIQIHKKHGFSSDLMLDFEEQKKIDAMHSAIRSKKLGNIYFFDEKENLLKFVEEIGLLKAWDEIATNATTLTKKEIKKLETFKRQFEAKEIFFKDKVKNLWS